jgi:hypothetical protein
MYGTLNPAEDRTGLLARNWVPLAGVPRPWMKISPVAALLGEVVRKLNGPGVSGFRLNDEPATELMKVPDESRQVIPS